MVGVRAASGTKGMAWQWQQHLDSLLFLVVPAGSMLHFYTAAGQSTTDFQVDKEAGVVTAIGIDDTGNIWTGHLKVSRCLSGMH
jgi:hypothetical protein